MPRRSSRRRSDRYNKRSSSISATTKRTPLKIDMSKGGVYRIERILTIIILFVIGCSTLILPAYIIYKRYEQRKEETKAHTEAINQLTQLNGGGTTTPPTQSTTSSTIQSIINEKISSTASDLLSGATEVVKNKVITL